MSVCLSPSPICFCSRFSESDSKELYKVTISVIPVDFLHERSLSFQDLLKATKLSLTQPSASSCMDLPEFYAFLHACCCHGALAGVGLAVAGTKKLITRGARLRQAKDEGLAGESLHPAHRVQTVLIVFTWVCGDMDAHEYVLQYSTVCSTI